MAKSAKTLGVTPQNPAAQMARTVALAMNTQYASRYKRALFERSSSRLSSSTHRWHPQLLGRGNSGRGRSLGRQPHTTTPFVAPVVNTPVEHYHVAGRPLSMQGH